MFRRKAPEIRVGDRFTKAGGTPRKVWTVMGITDGHVLVPHARLASESPSPESITISVRALADCALFLPLAPALAND